MNPDENLGVLEAARAIVAGRRVDWAAIESSADISESLAGLLHELKVVEGIAELHRSLPDPDASSASSLIASLSSSPPTAETAAAGTATWGSLRILERVGEGAFGDVYRAWDPRLDREVALKLIREQGPRHDSVGSLVIDEGRLLARVRHPNVVTVYGADRIDGRVGLWMEFVRGRTLEAVLRDHGPFGAQEAALIGLDVCRALSAVHKAGLIHRDVKAHNVMREAGGRIVLMDFGTGREELEGPRSELAGTPLYIAPESFASAPATPRSDIYAVGVLLYHLATGAYPIHGRTVADLREGHARGRRKWLRDERPELPDRFVQTVERALEVEPEMRYESAGAMEAALARVVATSDTDAAPANADPANAGAASAGSPNAVARPFRHRMWLGALAAAAAIVVTAFVAPAPWRARLLGGGGARRAQTPAGAANSSSVVVRRVSMPRMMLIGSPSFDGALFSMVDQDGNVAVVDLATGQLQRVTSDAVLDRDSQFAEFTAISPDNQFVAYDWNALDGKSELRVVDVEGKRPRVLLRNDAVSYPVPFEWTRDGKAILASLERTDHSVELALVSVEDGAVHTLANMNLPPIHASMSPMGDFVVYDAPQSGSAYARDIFIVRSNGSDARRLIEHPANDASPVWTPDGRRVLFASDRSGTADVWGVTVTGGVVEGQPQMVHRNVGRMTVRGLTDSGSYYYYLNIGGVDVYRADLTADGVRGVAPITPSYTGSNISSVFSLDGRRVAYASRRGMVGFDRGSSTLVIRDLQTGEQHEIVPRMRDYLVRSWSPDGRYVLVGGTDEAGRQAIFGIDVETGRANAFLSGEEIARPEWLSDGRLLYLNRAKGTLVRHDVQTGADEVVENTQAEGINLAAGLQGRGFRISPDGQYLAYTSSARSGEVYSRTIGVKPLGNGGTVRELARATSPEMILFQDWSPDGTSILFTRWSTAKSTEPTTLWRASIHGGDPQPMGLSMQGVRDLSVHPDGRSITFTAGWPLNELWVMENFLSDK